MAEANNFWSKMSVGKVGKKMSDWQPGQARSYIPVVNIGAPENIPVQGLVGKTVNLDGDKRVTFVVRGQKTLGTHKPTTTK
jgi:hypothetical protein